MQIELPKQERTAEVEILEHEGNRYVFKIDDKVFEIDLIEVSKGIYSLLNEGQSFNVEAIPANSPTKYTVNTFFQSFDLEIIDAQTKYLRSRNHGQAADTGNLIRVPMPGKVMEVFVEDGDTVQATQTLVIVSAMKMESEYKAGRDGQVKKVMVKPGDTVDSDQVMIVLE
ncbi:MAG: acetyl-CoA carboxylase biotin carboxyl carrier protein subunit [Bacteroidia bacterium]|nr:acetyl-CoA carboxylase biotin carboxyl carrier protein subunit [Bacteroidia bacterium]